MTAFGLSLEVDAQDDAKDPHKYEESRAAVAPVFYPGYQCPCQEGHSEDGRKHGVEVACCFLFFLLVGHGPILPHFLNRGHQWPQIGVSA